MRKAAKPQKGMGKQGRLILAVGWGVCAVFLSIQLWRALEYGTPSNGPTWGLYALFAALAALNAAAWLVSWLRYDRARRGKLE